MKRKNTEDPFFKLHRKNHQHEPDNLDLTKKTPTIYVTGHILSEFYFYPDFLVIKTYSLP